jgi:hypothetical protein
MQKTHSILLLLLLLLLFISLSQITISVNEILVNVCITGFLIGFKKS